MMIGMDDTIDFFAEVSTILDDDGVETDEDFPERYTLAMNRLRYERDKAVGVNPQYKFCPNCGYMIKDY